MTRTKKKLSEPAAWQAIARHIDTEQYGTFLCWHVSPDYADDFCVDVSPETRAAMLRRIDRYVERGPCGTSRGADFGDDQHLLSTREKTEARVLAALFLALEAADEARASATPEPE